MPDLTPEQLERIIHFVTIISSFIVLGYALRQLRVTTVSVMDAIKQQADQIPGKRLLIKKALWDYDIVVAGVLVIISGALDLIDKQLFAVFLGAILAGLGLKIAKDFSNPDTNTSDGSGE